MLAFVFAFGISGGEIFVIMLFVLIFFGSDKIPSLARNMGKAIRQVKDATSEIQRDIQNSANEVKDQVKKNMDQPEDNSK